MSLIGGGCPMSYVGGACASAAYSPTVPLTKYVPSSSCSKVCAGETQLKTCADQKVYSSEPKPNGRDPPFNSQQKDAAVAGGSTEASVAGSNGSKLPVPTFVLFSPDKLRLDWDKRVPFSYPTGLINAGNTCFLNSVLQCLTFTAPLANYFLQRGHQRERSCPEFCIMCQLQYHMLTCFNSKYNTIRPNAVLDNLPQIARHMERFRQEDAHEFLRCLTDAMQKRLLLGHNTLDRYSRETTLLNQIFGGYLRSQVVCKNCNAVSNTYEPFLDLSLEVKDVQHLSQALQAFSSTEILDKDNSYSCDSCKQKVRAHKRFTVHTAPNILTIQLKRYGSAPSHLGGPNLKLTRHMTFPLKLDLHPYMSDKASEHVWYDLYGVLIHSGMTTTSGHYYCCILAPNGRWYKLNDSVVTQVQIHDILREEAYMLFYKRNMSNRTPNTSASGIVPHASTSAVNSRGPRPVTPFQNGGGAWRPGQMKPVNSNMPRTTAPTTSIPSLMSINTRPPAMRSHCPSTTVRSFVPHSTAAMYTRPAQSSVNATQTVPSSATGVAKPDRNGLSSVQHSDKSSPSVPVTTISPVKVGERQKVSFTLKPSCPRRTTAMAAAGTTMQTSSLVPYGDEISDSDSEKADHDDVPSMEHKPDTNGASPEKPASNGNGVCAVASCDTEPKQLTAVDDVSVAPTASNSDAKSTDSEVPPVSTAAELTGKVAEGTDVRIKDADVAVETLPSATDAYCAVSCSVSGTESTTADHVQDASTAGYVEPKSVEPAIGSNLPSSVVHTDMPLLDDSDIQDQVAVEQLKAEDESNARLSRKRSFEEQDGSVKRHKRHHHSHSHNSYKSDGGSHSRSRHHRSSSSSSSEKEYVWVEKTSVTANGARNSVSQQQLSHGHHHHFTTPSKSWHSSLHQHNRRSRSPHRRTYHRHRHSRHSSHHHRSDSRDIYSAGDERRHRSPIHDRSSSSHSYRYRH